MFKNIINFFAHAMCGGGQKPSASRFAYQKEEEVLHKISREEELWLNASYNFDSLYEGKRDNVTFEGGGRYLESSISNKISIGGGSFAQSIIALARVPHHAIPVWDLSHAMKEVTGV